MPTVQDSPEKQVSQTLTDFLTPENKKRFCLVRHGPKPGTKNNYIGLDSRQRHCQLQGRSRKTVPCFAQASMNQPPVMPSAYEMEDLVDEWMEQVNSAYWTSRLVVILSHWL